MKNCAICYRNEILTKFSAGYNLALEDMRKEKNEKKKLWKQSRINRGLCLDCKKPLYSANYCFDHTMWRNKRK